jgi:phosphodiesterase/alkaline phosphatase D-like protein
VDITITPVEDTLIEGPETLTLTIGDSGSYDVGSPASATVNIQDNVVGVPPFLGVAAGDASTNSVVLWTRVDQQASVPVHAQVATASDFSGTSVHCKEQAIPAKDYTVKLVADGLQPGTRYYYRFVNDITNESSNTGTFKTVPWRPPALSPLHFGFSGDNDGLMRPFDLANCRVSGAP